LVADPVSHFEEYFDNVWRERGDVQRERAHFGDVSSKRAMDATALDTDDDAKIDGYPVDFGLGAAVCAHFVAGLGVTDLLQ
jgi:hypothetical protein